MARLTKDGALDRRTKEYRQRVEVEQMIVLILPGVKQAAANLGAAYRRLKDFADAHPELAEMQTAFSAAMEANNAAVLPMWNLLNKLEEAGAHDRWQAWCDYLNGKGPDPRP